ncbi:hypothetical protein N8I77_013387 [Diaporthe amygdali]|uniref:Uncharacterized protein n=1 Tax=Phomopsis amygdali TaxID=1214568 RepID=A0AAD9S1B8_PHOAM|nr:hypothetical protein N8I77_013387 [Diaporthe amygdali]
MSLKKLFRNLLTVARSIQHLAHRSKHSVAKRPAGCRDPVSKDLVEAYDIVHVRYLCFVPSNHEISNVLQNLTKLLMSIATSCTNSQHFERALQGRHILPLPMFISFHCLTLLAMEVPVRSPIDKPIITGLVVVAVFASLQVVSEDGRPR